MRFPTKDGAIDERTSAAMINKALEAGVNYFDTAWPYHDGHSEPFVGKILEDRKVRQDINLATKMPSWLIKSYEDLDTYFLQQLERLRTDYIDFYLLHALNQKHWDNYRKLEVFDWLEDKKREGRIRFAGFSFHDDYPVFEQIVQGYDWDFCQIQYNYMDVENQAGDRGLKLAADKGMGVVIMEPLLGGRLAKTPAAVRGLWDEAPERREPADWALQWVWNKPEVHLVLSGMSAPEQLEQNLVSADDAQVGGMTPELLGVFDRLREGIEGLKVIPCTSCEYCLPCPQGVNIPGNFSLFNNGVMFEDADGARGGYQWMKRSFELKLSSVDTRAINCIECGECVPKCPQGIKIDELMPTMHEVLSGEKSFEEAGVS